MKKKAFKILIGLCSLFVFLTVANAQQKTIPGKLRIGVSIGIDKITPESLVYAKSVGISSLETYFGSLLTKQSRDFLFSDEENKAKITAIKKAADDAGIEIWSIHMPYGQFIDISLTDEKERQEVLKLQKKMLEYCSILKPKVILFHPSWYLNLNEREERKKQLVRSVNELNPIVRKMNATMVVENMLGPELLVKGGKRERPLYRTVEESVEMMNLLPKNVYSAIDLNHIKDPEKLILAMGKRLLTLHVADGDGAEERHYFPCSGQGKNNWVEIFKALDQVKYKGPFMYESTYPDLKDLKPCYDSLYEEFVKAKN